jgi:hypothetical protein
MNVAHLQIEGLLMAIASIPVHNNAQLQTNVSPFSELAKMVCQTKVQRPDVR